MSAPTSAKVGAAVWDGQRSLEQTDGRRNPATMPLSSADHPARLLEEVRLFIARFVAFPLPAALDATTLWAAHAHMTRHLYTSPRLALLSPEPGSGKTRALEVLQLLVPNAMFSFSASPAAVFRRLDKHVHTLLFDEVDTVFSRRGKDDGNEDLRALLNAGYRRGATIPRCVGPNHDVRDFAVFAPTALAGLGDLPDTIMSRSIIVRMRRRAPGERVEQFRYRVQEGEGAALRERMAAWALRAGAEIGAAMPALPDGVEDRNAEVWEPLIAVADAAGGHWPATARAASLALLKIASDREVSLGVRLLRDLRLVFGDNTTMTTADILDALNEMDEAPWGGLYGKPLEPRTLAQILKRYGVSSVKVKVESRSLKGYRREHLWDAWTRYLPADTAQGEPEEPTTAASGRHVGAASGDAAIGFPAGANVAEPAESMCAIGVGQERPSSRKAEASAHVAVGTQAKVPQVPLAHNGRVRGAAWESLSLADRARSILDRLGAMPRADVQQMANELVARARTAPDWLRVKAIGEPLTVAVALSLVEEDARSGSSATFPKYLNAAQTAINGA